MGKTIADNVLQTIENAVNTELITKYYFWDLIKDDPDDHKFVDCAIACNAKFLVTQDKHFNVLKRIDFPKVKVITVKQFKNELNI